MNCQIIVFLTVAVLAKEILGATAPTTFTVIKGAPKDKAQNGGARVQRQFGFLGSIGSEFGAAAQGAGAGFGQVAKGIGSGFGDALHGRPTEVHHNEGQTNSVSIAVNNAPGGTANSASAAENRG